MVNIALDSVVNRKCYDLDPVESSIQLILGLNAIIVCYWGFVIVVAVVSR